MVPPFYAIGTVRITSVVDTVATQKIRMFEYRKISKKKDSQRPESDISEAVKSAKRDRMADFNKKYIANKIKAPFSSFLA